MDRLKIMENFRDLQKLFDFPQNLLWTPENPISALNNSKEPLKASNTLEDA